MQTITFPCYLYFGEAVAAAEADNFPTNPSKARTGGPSDAGSAAWREWAAFLQTSGRRHILVAHKNKSEHRRKGNGARTVLCMATCEVCENDYDKAFEVIVAGKHHTFDSFECAIHALAPVCPHCQCRVVGHGVEANGQIFCCVHCARTAGKTQLKDRV